MDDQWAIAARLQLGMAARAGERETTAVVFDRQEEALIEQAEA